ncbi:hypothetical protein DVK00_02850 [Haloarcula sp. Atlit-47R]|uniref:hypothetical protein n=1 Tax=Haloarcula sp. Atlit-47R TaxID=2282132 RepID=UPI000EF23A30|nr:hypothetical protein [Haloarcula sp. Atlit-47R]RLM47463.1 hypothetical protein DVK00_02850 [Haloarcula sp. Atlit-47R]
MTEIVNTAEEQIELTDDLPFCESADVAAGSQGVAYDFTIPKGYVLTIRRGTAVAPALVDANGDELDDASTVKVQKADRQSNALGGQIAFREAMSAFDYSEMRSEPDKMRVTTQTLVADEQQHVHVYVDVPSGASDLDVSTSNLVIGDNTSPVAPAVRLKKKNDLPADVRQQVEQNSQ